MSSRPPSTGKADLVAYLSTVLPDADTAALTDAVSTAKLSAARCDKILTRLRQHPDALTSGNAAGPPGLQTLLAVLAESHPQVARMRCADCGDERVLPYRRGGASICPRCYTRTHLKTCIRCGELGHPAFRENGGIVCGRCQRRDPAHHQPCTGCGKAAPVSYRVDGDPFCQNCGPHKYYTCSQCGRENQRAQAVTADGAVCSRCYHLGRARECGTCGRSATYTRRDDQQAGAWICYRCWTPPTLTCTRCGRERPCAHGLARGEPVCSTCKSKQRPPRACARCGNIRRIQTTLPLGPVCGACYRHLRRTPGPCSTCHATRPLVGYSPSGAPVCGPCAGDGRNWKCDNCGRVDLLIAGTVCLQCSVTARLDAVLRGPDGRIHPQLDELRRMLLHDHTAEHVNRLLNGVKWIRMLDRLTTAGAPITHADLDALAQSSHVHHLRSVLVHTGALDDRDADLVSTQIWLDTFLGDLPADIAGLLRPYATWSVLRRARHRASRFRLTPSVPRYARTRILVASHFLAWLADHDRTLTDATQTDIDRWLDDGAPSRRRLRDFIRWANSRHVTDHLHVPWLGREGLPEHLLDEHERWTLLRRCLVDDTLELRLRVAGALVLLYGQIPARIVELTAGHLEQTDAGTRLVLDTQPVLIPPTLADLTARLRDQRRDRAPLQSAIATPEWLFPGSLPGGHLTGGRLASLLTARAGVPVRAARGAALFALAADLPAPVLADLLGISVAAATRWSALASRDNAEYLAARTLHPPHPVAAPTEGFVSEPAPTITGNSPDDT